MSGLRAGMDRPACAGETPAYPTHQRDSAMEARYLKEQLEAMLGGVEIFLDFR